MAARSSSEGRDRGGPHEAEPVTIFHNPGCGTSQKVLAAIRSAGIEPTIVHYMERGWTRASLLRVLDALGVRPHAILRMKAVREDEAGDMDDEALLAAMVADPSLVERPIVLTAKGAALCRPADRLKALL